MAMQAGMRTNIMHKLINNAIISSTNLFNKYLITLVLYLATHTSTESIRISAFVFSAFNSSSTFNSAILGLVYFFGCISNPAYENVFLNATPEIKRESCETMSGVHVAMQSSLYCTLNHLCSNTSYKKITTISLLLTLATIKGKSLANN